MKNEQKLIKKTLKIRKRTIVVWLSGFLLGTLLSFGLTYSYFSAVVIGNEDAEEIVVTTAGDLQLIFTDSNAIIGEGIVPGWTDYKSFSVENPTDITASYTIMWDSITNEFVGNDLVYTLSGSNSREETIMPYDDKPILKDIEILPHTTHSYLLTVEFKNQEYNQDVNKEKTFSGRIQVTTDFVDYNLITTANELYNVRNKLNGTYELANDIDISTCTVTLDCATNWEPIGLNAGNGGTGEFSGFFDGNGYTISNLIINRTTGTTTRVGLFGNTTGATIKNVNLENVDIHGNNYTGALVATLTSGEASNNTVSGTLTCNGFCGGLIGRFDGGLVSNNTSLVNVTSTGECVGGLIGEVSFGNTYNNIATGTVTASSSGNLAAYGGLIGRVNPYEAGNTNIKGNYASGMVLGSRYAAGGLIGKVSTNQADNEIIIEENFATGNSTLTKTGGSVGGLLGEIFMSEVNNNKPVIVRNNYSSGIAKITVTPEVVNSVGGLIGATHAATYRTVKATLINNYTRSSFVGSFGNPSSLVGYLHRSSNTYSSNYWDTQVSSNTYAADRITNISGIAGLNTSGFKTATPFSGWDSNIWEFSNTCYPILKNNVASKELQRQLLGC